MDQEVLHMADLIAKTASPLKTVREDAEASLDKAIIGDLAKFCEVVLVLLGSKT